MPALVPELVNAAIDASVSPGDLLRRALVVARRLAVPELVDWISSELNGYYSGEVPDYRRVQGQLMAENPIHGPIPFFFAARHGRAAVGLRCKTVGAGADAACSEHNRHLQPLSGQHRAHADANDARGERCDDAPGAQVFHRAGAGCHREGAESGARMGA